MTVEDPLRQFLVEREIERVQHTYARAVDRRDWDLLRDVFHADAIDEHGPYHGDVDGLVKFLEVQLADVESTTHQMGNCLVEHVTEGVARVETYATCVHRHVRADGSAVDLSFWVRYLDRFERRDGGWRIADRVVVVDRSRGDEVVHGAGIAAEFTTGRAGPDDPSYP